MSSVPGIWSSTSAVLNTKHINPRSCTHIDRYALIKILNAFVVQVIVSGAVGFGSNPVNPKPNSECRYFSRHVLTPTLILLQRGEKRTYAYKKNNTVHVQYDAINHKGEELGVVHVAVTVLKVGTQINILRSTPADRRCRFWSRFFKKSSNVAVRSGTRYTQSSSTTAVGPSPPPSIRDGRNTFIAVRVASYFSSMDPTVSFDPSPVSDRCKKHVRTPSNIVHTRYIDILSNRACRRITHI